MDEKLTLFVAVTSAAVVLQVFVLAAIYFTLRKLSAGVTTTTDEVKAQALPLLENLKTLLGEVKKILETSAPKLELVLDNAAAITTTAHSGLGRVETTVNDVLDRARLQIIRADDMVTRALDEVEETTEKVTRSVTSPIKRANGIMQGISTGVSAYFGQKRPRERGPSEQMFI